LDVLQDICDFAKEEEWMLAFIDSFLVNKI